MTANPVLDFRPIFHSDAPLLTGVARRTYADHYLHLWHDGGEWYMNRSFTLDVLRQELAGSNVRFYLIYQYDQPVGFMKLVIDQPSPCYEAANTLELERIYLMKTATGHGIGSACMQFVLDQAGQLNKQLIWLKAMDSSHKAIAFYRKMGFEPCGTTRLSFDVMKEEFRGMVVLQRLV